MSTPQDDGDYQHDQAHELVHGRLPSPTPHDDRQPPVPPKSPPVRQDGDYEYDQAHDFGQDV